MDENKMHLINKIFNNETIRAVWDKEDEKYYISVVDIVSIISESKDGRKYWNKLKQRLKELLLAGLEKSGQILYFASKDMRDDKDVVFKAIEDKPIIIKYASKRLRNDLDIGIRVMNKNKKCFKFLEPELQSNEKIQEIKNAE